MICFLIFVEFDNVWCTQHPFSRLIVDYFAYRLDLLNDKAVVLHLRAYQAGNRCCKQIIIDMRTCLGNRQSIDGGNRAVGLGLPRNRTKDPWLYALVPKPMVEVCALAHGPE